MNPVKNNNTGKTVEPSVKNRAVPRKLLQLNLHQALRYNFQAHQILGDLRQKQQSDAIVGKAYIAESVIRLNEALFGNCFHLNALTSGGYTDLFSHLDNLKARVNSLIDEPPGGAPADSSESSIGGEDPVSHLLLRLIKETSDPHRLSHDGSTVDPSPAPGIGSMLSHLSELTITVADRMLSLAVEPEVNTAKELAVLPVGYVNNPAPSDTPGNVPPPENETVHMIIDGLKVMEALALNDSRLCPPGKSHPRTIVLHSAHETSQFFRSGAFCSVVGAAVFDDAAGNFIYLMIAPGEEEIRAEQVIQLLLKSLYWLDFDTTDHRQIICAGIRNLTRAEMGDHLNMLGKLLAFAASVSNSLENEQSIQNSVEYFLETVI